VTRPPDPTALLAYLNSQRERAAEWLQTLIAIPSVSGYEQAVQEQLAGLLRGLGFEVVAETIPESLRQDEEFSHYEQEQPYAGRPNLFVTLGGGQGRSLILASHTDVVPAQDWPAAFAPERRDDLIVGRGACDDKGQVVTALLTLSALRHFNLQPRGRLEAQFVIEEEVGGNGALATLRAGHRADGVVVLEPTQLQIHPANRGAVWFRFTITGRPVHMGRKYEGVSAIDHALELIGLLYDYERRLVAESANVPQFERYERPVQLNVGTIHGGEWPSMVPARVVLEGGVGFLPNKTMVQIKEELRQVVEKHGSEWLRAHYTLEFPKLHNDSYSTASDHPLPLALQEACRRLGFSPEIFGWNVSCDARLYNRLGGMPTLVFGPGNLADAHSEHERIDLGDIVNGAAALVLLVAEWCGLA